MGIKQKPKAPCYVLGVGMTKFVKPRGKVDYTELGFEAGVKAMLDAKISYEFVSPGLHTPPHLLRCFPILSRTPTNICTLPVTLKAA